MGKTADLASMLRTTPLFARITSRADMLQMERMAQCEIIDAGASVIVEGTPVQSIDIIQSGEMSVRLSAGTVESLRLGPGSLYGEMEFFQKTLGLATLVATEKTNLIRVKYTDLQSLAEDNPMTGMQLYHGFLNTMVGKHRLVTDSLIDVKLDTSRQHLAHDLRSPLAVLRVLVDNVTSLPEDQRELLSQVTLRIESIVSGLTAGSPQPKNLLAGCGFLASLQDLIEEKKLQMASKPRTEMQVIVPASLDRFDVGPHSADLIRVVSNILNNAIEALPPGEGQVTLRCWENDISFAIDIHDNGVGMSSEFIERLGTQPITAGKSGGQGLGLFYAFRLIESLGGQMMVQSEKNVGTMMGFRLPARHLQAGKSTRLHTNMPSNKLSQMSVTHP